MSRDYLEHLADRLNGLTDVISPAGYEDAMIRKVLSELPTDVHEVKVDNLGNVIVHINKTKDPNPFKVMVFAHMDEVGFIIKKIEEDGFIRVERLGGIPEKSMPGQSVTVETLNGRISGIIGTKSHHVTKPEEKFKLPQVHESYLDFGFRTKGEAIEAGVTVGLPVVYERQFFRRNSIVFSNAIDNRAGCLILLEIIDRLIGKSLSCEVVIVFSVQEEFSLRGVLPAVRAVNPDVSITLDLVVAADTPDLKGTTDTRLGEGPCLNLYSFHGRGTLGGLIPNPKLVNFVKEAAEDEGVTLQLSTFMGGLTDASFSQLENEGIPMIDLAFPTRYTHAPIEAVHLNDLSELIRLLEKLIPSFHGGVDFKRG
jgi:putative aminopeptidase FrvX